MTDAGPPYSISNNNKNLEFAEFCKLGLKNVVKQRLYCKMTHWEHACCNFVSCVFAKISKLYLPFAMPMHSGEIIIYSNYYTRHLPLV